MADSTTNLDLIAVNQAAKEVTANGLLDAASPATVFGRRQSGCLGLVWAYYGGRLGMLSVANGSVTLTASATNYLTVHRTTGAVAVSTNAVAWCTPETHARLYRITTTASAAGSYEDHRFSAWGVLPANMATAPMPVVLSLVQGDASTAVTTGTRKSVTRAPQRMLISAIRASLATASSSGLPAIDVNASGASLLGTTITLDVNERTSTTAATPHTITDGGDVLDDDEEVDFDIDTAGTSATQPRITIIGIASRTSRYADVRALALTGTGANASQPTTDSSVRPKAVSWSGGAAITTSVAPAGASSSIAFDGVDDRIELAAPSGSTEFALRDVDSTINVHIRHDGSSSSFGCVWVFYLGAVAYGLLIKPSTREVQLADSSSLNVVSATNAVPAAGTWYRLKTVRTGGTVLVFVDGVQIISTTYNPLAMASPVMRCGLNFNGTQPLQCYMRDIEVIPHIATHTAAHTPTRRLMPTF